MCLHVCLRACLWVCLMGVCKNVYGCVYVCLRVYVCVYVYVCVFMRVDSRTCHAQECILGLSRVKRVRTSVVMCPDPEPSAFHLRAEPKSIICNMCMR